MKKGLVDTAELWYSCYSYRGPPTPERLHNFQCLRSGAGEPGNEVMHAPQ